MAILSKLRKWLPAHRQWTPTDDPDIVRLRQRLNNSEWAPVQEFFAQVQDFSDRSYYANALVTWEGRPPCFDRWTAAEPDCALAWLLRGAHSVKWAWEARTGARAQEVEAGAWPVFFQRLQAAREDLERAAQLDPSNPTCYGPLITAAKGLELSLPHVQGWLQAARRLDPQHEASHAAVLSHLCRKWHGTHEAMFAFARQTCQELQEGSPLFVLLAHAHFERWYYAKFFDNDESLAGSYWSSPEVREELRNAYRQSLGSPQHRPNRLTPNHRNYFAFCLVRIGETSLARQEFERIGALYAEYPWVALGFPTWNFFKHRKLAGA